MSYVAFFAFLSLTTPIIADREHKVHNIVLYPERHSWCQTTPIKQVVALPGYESLTIDNNVCVGACYSYSIPRTQPAEPGELIGPYCDSCQPVDTRCYHVNLKADEKNEDGPRTIQKRVQIITNCTCLSCNKIQTTDCEITDESTAELPLDLFAILYGNTSLLSFNSSYDDVKELLNLPKDRTDIALNTTNMKEEQKIQLKLKLVQMVKSLIEANMAKQENGILLQLVGVLENPKTDINPKSLISLFNSVSGEEIDVAKIKEIMLSIKRDQELLEKHRNFGLGNYLVDMDTSKKNSDINRDLENIGKTYNIKSFGIEGSHAGKGDCLRTFNQRF
ncbi:hypothetical protein AMK59_7241 [Oryctes borbonicus]|uniref:DAN domain-containing protein n=1 Tax=Oryctes borbonicus TaxID=1629725 RepID=A0A0T6AY08_9SCAR|nr:hypothetical protein AMK59_7241 [Oryctes borbonicus]